MTNDGRTIGHVSFYTRSTTYVTLLIMYAYYMNLFLHLRIFYPYILAILFLFLSAIPLGALGLNSCRPMIQGMLIFYFALYRPYFYPYWFLFLIGMCYDAVLGLPLGMNALTNIALKAFMLAVRTKYLRAPFGAVWIQFSLLMLVIILLQWGMMSFTYGNFFHGNMAAIQLLLSISLYPFFHRMFVYVSKMTPRGVTEEKIVGNYYK